MKLQLTTANDFTVVKIEENRIDAANSPQLRLNVKELADTGITRIILDLSQVQFMDSSGLGVMVGILKMLGANGDLVIAGANGIVADLFKLTRMDRVFRMCPDTASAADMLATV